VRARGHPGGSLGGRRQACQHLDGGGLPGSIRAEEAEDLASVNVEGDMIHSQCVIITLCQVLYFDGSQRHYYSFARVKGMKRDWN
jgi:hypothetical protein